MSIERAIVDERLSQVLRDERGRLTGALVRILGDWVMAAARRKAVDRLRRQARYRERMEQLTREASVVDAGVATGGPMEADDRLPLLFTCCHPALSREAQVALTLRTIGGVGTPGGARALLG